jgi:hypothetical protein
MSEEITVISETEKIEPTLSAESSSPPKAGISMSRYSNMQKSKRRISKKL